MNKYVQLDLPVFWISGTYIQSEFLVGAISTKKFLCVYMVYVRIGCYYILPSGFKSN